MTSNFQKQRLSRYQKARDKMQIATEGKGNLGVRSGALAPTGCKLAGQYLILDHMTNHFNKMDKVKSAIDASPPKSLKTSQKMRDRKTREDTVKTPRPKSRTSKSPSKVSVKSSTQKRQQPDIKHEVEDVVSKYQDVFNEEPVDDEERLVFSIMKKILLNQPEDYDRLNHRSNPHPESQGRNTLDAEPSQATATGAYHSNSPSLLERPATGQKEKCQ